MKALLWCKVKMASMMIAGILAGAGTLISYAESADTKYGSLKIVSWSSSGGHTQKKNSPKDLIYRVNKGDKITFTVKLNKSCTCEWKVMEGAKIIERYIEKKKDRSVFKWQVPNRISTWDIEVEVYRYKPAIGPYKQDHKIWTITTSKIISLAPGKDIQKAINSLPKEGGVVELKEGIWELDYNIPYRTCTSWSNKNFRI